MERSRSIRLEFVALLFSVLLVLVGHDSAGAQAGSAPSEARGPATRIVVDPGGFIETLLPNRPYSDIGSWADRGSETSRHSADAAVLAALVAVFILGYAALLARQLGRPLLRDGGRGAVVRGPPSLRMA